MLAKILKGNDCHQPKGKPDGGQFCEKPGAGSKPKATHYRGDGTEGKKLREAPGKEFASPSDFDAAKWKAQPFMESRAKWKSLSREEKDAYGNPRVTVKARMDELLASLGERPYTKDLAADISKRIDSAVELIPEEARQLARTMMQSLQDSLKAAGVSEEGVREISMDATDHLLAQDIESQGRTLGDHGIHHLYGDAQMSRDILAVLPGAHNTPLNQALMNLAAVYHDAGYLTPPSRAFLDADHPRWSAQYFQEHVAPMMEKYFSRDFVQLASQVIYSHDVTGINWETEAELSAFSTSDNLALFHKEKMPPLIRYVGSNTKVLVDLAQQKISVSEAQKRMIANIDAQKDLTDSVKARLKEAVPEVSGLLPKFTLGMVGTKYDGVSWQQDHLVVNVTRTNANEELAKVLDLGQKQFAKLAETYGKSADDFIKDKHLDISDGRKTLLEVRVRELIRRFEEIFKGNECHNPAGPGGGQFCSGGKKGGGSLGEPRQLKLPLKGGRTAKKFNKVLKKQEAGIEAARKAVSFLGEEDGNEHGVLIDGNGKSVIQRTSGSPTEIEFSEEDLARMSQGSAADNNSWVMVHNHPSRSALSIQDIMFATTQNLRAVEAVGADGSFYRATINENARKLPGVLKETHRMLDQGMYQLLSASIMLGDISITEAQYTHNLLMVQALDKLGLIKLEYKLGPDVLGYLNGRHESSMANLLRDTMVKRVKNAIKYYPDPEVKEAIRNSKIFDFME